MSYFTKFPLANYQFNDDKYLVVNITKEVDSTFSLDDPAFYIEYEIKDGDTPIILAEKLYDDAGMAWTILAFNKMISVYEDWPLDYQSLIRYVQDKCEDVYEIHHYESISTGLTVGTDYPSYDTLPVTNLEHEIKLNDDKRKIKMITPDYIGSFISQHNNKVENRV